MTQIRTAGRGVGTSDHAPAGEVMAPPRSGWAVVRPRSRPASGKVPPLQGFVIPGFVIPGGRGSRRAENSFHGPAQ